MKLLKYPFTFEQWKKHKTTKVKLALIKKVVNQIKYGEKLEFNM
jgi:hypothetical protein